MRRFRGSARESNRERLYPNQRLPHVFFGRVFTASDYRAMHKARSGKGQHQAYYVGLGKKPEGKGKGHLRVAGSAPPKAESEDDIWYQMEVVVGDLSDKKNRAKADVFGESEIEDPKATVADITARVIEGLDEELDNFDKAVREFEGIPLSTKLKHLGIRAGRPETVEEWKAFIESLRGVDFDVFTHELMTGAIERSFDRLRPFVLAKIEEIHPRVYGRLPGDTELYIDRLLTTRSDLLPTAGNILADEERHLLNLSIGPNARKFIYAHDLEEDVLRIAVLRQLGIRAYLADAIIPTSEHAMAYVPLYTIADHRLTNPLHIFSEQRMLPDGMCGVQIKSDAAVEAMLYAMRAEMRAKQLAAEIVIRFLGNPAVGGADSEFMNDSEFRHNIKRIAQDCVSSYVKWGEHNPGSDFEETIMMSGNRPLFMAINAINREVYRAHAWVYLRAVFNRGGLTPAKLCRDPLLEGKRIDKSSYVVPIDPQDVEMFLATPYTHPGYDKRIEENVDEVARMAFCEKYRGLAEVAGNIWEAAATKADKAVDLVESKMNSVFDKMTRQMMQKSRR